MDSAEKRLRKKILRVGIIATVLSALVLILSGTLLKNWIIIGFGVRFYSGILIVEATIVGFAAVFTLGCSVPLLKEKLHKKQSSQILTRYAEDSENPELAKARLTQLVKELPWTQEIVQQCQEQMRTMDTLQARQETLIKANDAVYLKDTVEVLNNVERRLCRNFQSIINLCIVASSNGGSSAGKINKLLVDNQDKLKNAAELLRVSADWINQYNADSDTDRSEVERWIAVIQTSLRED